MSQPAPRIIPEVIEQYLEELGFLWGQRRDALKSPDYAPADVTELEKRIEAHLDGLLFDGEATIPFLWEALGGDDPGPVFAAAYALLLLKSEEAAERVIEALHKTEGEPPDGIREALCHGPIALIRKQLREAVDSARAPVAAAALEALVFHGAVEPGLDRLVELIEEEDPQVRKGAWRIASMLDFDRTRDLYKAG